MRWLRRDADQAHRSINTSEPANTIRPRERARYWEVRDSAGELVCLTVYKRGAREVVRRLGG